MKTLISFTYNFLWGDLVYIPLPSGGTAGLSLLILILIPLGIFFTLRLRFLPIRLFPDMIQDYSGEKRTWGERINFRTADTDYRDSDPALVWEI